ncbi:MAG: dTDP-4-dehydrorhamnose 3,5-epimerase [Frankiales bacterium]|nr:dTDP-4-dehydrorhamnose 3,5-epimerase [Frankiales bacterium]
MQLTETTIPGLLHVELDLHADPRGWFKESYQRAKLEAAGMPRLEVVQNNVSYNAERHVARGVHAEPWDKYVSPAHGRIFCAIADLREGPTFGTVETFELGPGQALFVPRGCGNSYLTLDEHVVYNYLVNAHWSPEAEYVLVNLFDPTLAIPWPVPRQDMIISAKDAAHPALDAVRPFGSHV